MLHRPGSLITAHVSAEVESVVPQAKLAPKLTQMKALEQKQALLVQGLAQYADNDPERIALLSKFRGDVRIPCADWSALFECGFPRDSWCLNTHCCRVWQRQAL